MSAVGLEFGLLGPVEVKQDGRALPLGGPKQRAVLAILLLEAGRPVSTERLVDALWGERPPRSAANSVHVYVSALRKALGADRLERRPSGYVLRIEPDELDVVRFERQTEDARAQLAAGRPDEAARTIAGALALVRGAPLADIASTVEARTEIAHLVELVLTAREDRLEAEVAAGRAQRAVPELQSLVREHPLRERARALLMLALYRSGRQAEALAVYRDAVRALRDELGLEPGRELRELEHAILTHDPSVDAPRAGPTRGPPSARRGVVLAAVGGALLVGAVAVAVAVAVRDTERPVRVVGDAVAVIDPRSERVVDAIPVGAEPQAVAFGSGAVWVANTDDDTISRVDPASRRQVRTIRLDFRPTGLATTPDGLWAVGSRPAAQAVAVARIDPQFDAVAATTRVTNVIAGGAGAIAARNGRVWVAPTEGLLTELDASGATRQRVDPGAGATAVAVGDGEVWLADKDAGAAVRVDATGVATPLAVGSGPGGIAVGAGAVWVADTFGDAVVRIDPDTRAVVARIRAGRSPEGIAVGAGAVWVANSRDGTVSRIDPRTNGARTIEVGGTPRQLVVARGKVWVTVAPAPRGPAAPSGGVLRVASEAEFDHLDPALAHSVGSWQLLHATCAKLVNYPDREGAEGSRLVPEVAAALPRVSADRRTYTFTLRPGFRFSPPSRETVTAHTFKHAIERSLDPAMRGEAQVHFGNIVGAKAFIAGKAAHVRGIVARGRTLVVRLSEPAPDFVTRIALPFSCAVPRNAPIDPKGVRALPSAGPYYVASFTPGRAVLLRRNPNYRGPRPHRPEEISVVLGQSAATTTAQVEAGTLDHGLDGVPPSERTRLLARHGPGSTAARAGRQRYFVNSIPAIYYLALNTSRPPFASARLRRAVNHAIDRRALARLGSPLSPYPSQPDDRYLPPGIPGSGGPRVYPLTPDLPRARALAGREPHRATMYTCNTAPCLQVGQVVRKNLAAVGIDVTVRPFTLPALFERLGRRSEPFDIATIGWVADAPDPGNVLGPGLDARSIGSPGSANYARFSDPEWNHRLAAAARLSGPARYLAYARLSRDIAREEAPWAAIGNAADEQFFSSRVGCHVYHPLYGVVLAALCLR